MSDTHSSRYKMFYIKKDENGIYISPATMVAIFAILLTVGTIISDESASAAEIEEKVESLRNSYESCNSDIEHFEKRIDSMNSIMIEIHTDVKNIKEDVKEIKVRQ